VVTLGAHTLTLQPGQTLRQGKWDYVPLKLLVDSLGVSMSLAPDTQQVTLTRPTTREQFILAVADPDRQLSPAPQSTRKGVHSVWEVTQPLYLGSVQDGKPIHDEEPTTGSITVKLYNLRRYLGMSRLTPHNDREDHLSISLSPRLLDAQENIIAIAGRWNALPRPAHAGDVKSPALRQLVKDLLRRKGLPTAPVKIDAVEVVDLLGDGHQQWLIVGENWNGESDMDIRKNDYGYALLAYQDNGIMQTQLIDGFFFNKKQEAPMVTYSIAGVLDIDGDGAEEIIVDVSSSDEVGGTIAYRLRNGKLEQVMENTWQD
jgi:hypothetical protein